MKTVGRRIPRNRLGQSCALCATCSARFFRGQLVRGSDGQLRCSGPGTFNDAKGFTEKELDEKVASASLNGAMRFRFSDDPGPYDGGTEI